jgi:hypothetical protein
MADGLLMDNSRLPLEPNDMLLYPNPDQAPERHPSLAFIEGIQKPEPNDTQLLLCAENDKSVAGDDET